MADRLDTTACDREPIHVSGSIQPHGVLMSLDPSNLSVLQVSCNTREMLGLEPESILGKKLDEFLNAGDAHALSQHIEGISREFGTAYLRSLRSPVSDLFFCASAHRYDTALILELELADPPESFSFNHVYPLVIRMPELLTGAPTLEKTTEIAAAELRRLTNFERVLVIKFAPDWSGYVVAESKLDDISSFLDLWFPATDIPAPARRLYEINRIRIISDAAVPAVPIRPSENPLTGRPLDLSLSILRSVSPIHIEYMKNMGVASSLSMPLLQSNGRLWGIISCHHRKPCRTSLDVRTACEIMARMLASQIEKVEISELRASIERAVILRSLSKRLIGFMSQEQDFIDGLTSYPEELFDFVQAAGASIVYGGRCARLGDCPSEADIRKIVQWLDEHGENETFATDRAPELIDRSEGIISHASGILSIGLSKTGSAYVLWFRPELVKTVKWGGDPRKTEARNGTSAVLHPRKSFEVWQETIKGRSKSWTDGELEAAMLLRDSILGSALPIS